MQGTRDTGLCILFSPDQRQQFVSGLHMSSLPSFLQFHKQSSYQSNNMIHTTTKSCVMWSRGAAATWFPQNSAEAMMVSSSLIQIYLDTHVDAELMLIQDEEEKIISYNSIPLFEKQRRYCMTELLAIVRFIGKYRCYLLMRPLFELTI